MKPRRPLSQQQKDAKEAQPWEDVHKALVIKREQDGEKVKYVQKPILQLWRVPSFAIAHVLADIFAFV